MNIAMNSQLGPEVATFRPRLRVMAAGVFAFVIPFAVAALAIDWINGRIEAERIARLVEISAVAIGLIPIFWVAVVPFGLKVHEQGLAGRTRWGRRAFVRWEDILEVRKIGALSDAAFYLVVIPSVDPAIEILTLPEIVSRSDFQLLVAKLAGANSPFVTNRSAA